ncbi:DUF2325 domain-containing protein [Herbaspirillum sp. WKF16]|uniref:DUF2325 domain-containing protein n=1 Tax=Herbaspirillum sp. WKF16 TaxID=3028312 RepID=UPI0023AA000C|nr:DUF2325 domain-containing protein [Herbaspirillum sp. WKF16]WDZ96247.1 DUF2325 domain-containing protein [Herbaspirillum sp. WKF16]
MTETMFSAPSAPWPCAPAGAEQAALVRHLAAAQRRCSDTIARQAEEIAMLRAQAMRMRAAIIARDSALAWAIEDRAALEAAQPDLAPRATLARKVRELSGKLQDLMRDTLRPPVGAPARASHAPQRGPAADAPALSALEASVAGADLVICQTGCLSHGDYWRVQDHCKRTGKTCVLVAQPASFRVMRIHRDARARLGVDARVEVDAPETAG